MDKNGRALRTKLLQKRLPPQACIGQKFGCGSPDLQDGTAGRRGSLPILSTSKRVAEHYEALGTSLIRFFHLVQKTPIVPSTSPARITASKRWNHIFSRGS